MAEGRGRWGQGWGGEQGGMGMRAGREQRRIKSSYIKESYIRATGQEHSQASFSGNGRGPPSLVFGVGSLTAAISKCWFGRGKAGYAWSLTVLHAGIYKMCPTRHEEMPE